MNLSRKLDNSFSDVICGVAGWAFSPPPLFYQERAGVMMN